MSDPVEWGGACKFCGHEPWNEGDDHTSDCEARDRGPLCCGCICERCSEGHRTGPDQHTEDCWLENYNDQTGQANTKEPQ